LGAQKTSNIPNGIIPNKLNEPLKLLNLRFALFTPIQKAVIHGTFRRISFSQNSKKEVLGQ
jgi:hypothetical protein